MQTFKKVIRSLTLVPALLVALPAFAQSASSGLINPLKAASIQALLGEIMQFVVWLGGVILTLMLIYVGFLFVSARGNEEKITQARNALLWTIIGGLILLGASAIASVIVNTATSL